MKYIKTFTALFAALVLLSAEIVFAMPPSNVAASYDSANGMVTITASHNVNDGKKHFVMSMAVSEGGNQILSKKYTEQKSNEVFTDSVKLPGVKQGSKITVLLTCNIMGAVKDTITVK
ncbi:MAG: hypothetical protein Q4E17_01210 [Synergistes sp.]|nr:hypothetical protein [Synergistes sp.]